MFRWRAALKAETHGMRSSPRRIWLLPMSKRVSRAQRKAVVGVATDLASYFFFLLDLILMRRFGLGTTRLRHFFWAIGAPPPPMA